MTIVPSTVMLAAAEAAEAAELALRATVVNATAAKPRNSWLISDFRGIRGIIMFYQSLHIDIYIYMCIYIYVHIYIHIIYMHIYIYMTIRYMQDVWNIMTYPLVIKHGNGEPPLNGGVHRKITGKWSICNCHDYRRVDGWETPSSSLALH